MLIKSALVTGGGGFVGKAIVRKLLDQGVETRIIGRSRYPDVETIGARCWQGDIVDTEALREAARGVDVVFHTAALAGIWGTWSAHKHTNIEGTRSVIEACRKEKIDYLVYTSTPSVVFNSEDICGGNETLPYGDKVLCHYAKSKIIAEQDVLAANSDDLATCALRPHLIWGPGDPHLLPRIVDSARKGRLKIVGDAANLVDISYIDNVAEAHVLAAEKMVSGGNVGGNAYFISQGEPVNLWAWLNELFDHLNIAKLTTRVSFKSAYRVGTVLEMAHRLLGIDKDPRMTRFLAEQLAKSHYFSIDKARMDFGYRPSVSTPEGLQRTVAWLKTL